MTGDKVTPLNPRHAEMQKMLEGWLRRGKLLSNTWRKEPIVFQLRKDGVVKFYLYTKTYRYQIVAHTNTEKGYLGCQAGVRMALPGEDWTRGSDLTDGPFGEKTWNAILSDIVAHECVAIVPEIKRCGDAKADGEVDGTKEVGG